jgi:hypothetical protein
MRLGELDYRRGGLQRLRESQILFDVESFAGAIYFAGRAVESMLRALIWKHDRDIQSGKKSLDTGHDLRDMLAHVRDLGVLHEAEVRAELAVDIQHVARLWFNNMRFFSDENIRSVWFKLGEIGGRRTMEQAALEYQESCSAIVQQCEVLCQR